MTSISPAVPPSELTEIAFIFNDARVQAHFMATQAQLALLSAYQERLDAREQDGPRQFDVLPWSSDGSSSASHLVETLVDALDAGLEEEDRALWASAVLLAAQVDSLAERSRSQVLTLEFIWNNGGGDDNIFSQSFRSALGSDAEEVTNRFVETIELAGADSFYDFDVSPEGSKMTLLNLQEFLGDQKDEAALEELAQVIDQVVALDPLLPASVRRSPGP